MIKEPSDALPDEAQALGQVTEVFGEERSDPLKQSPSFWCLLDLSQGRFRVACTGGSFQRIRSMAEDGRESVICNRSDGYGLSRLREAGVDVMILSSEINPVVDMRAKKLQCPCRSGLANKVEALREEMAKHGVSTEHTAFVGNDINDSECLRAVGFPVVVSDAFDEVKALARLVLRKRGGDAAVREFCDLVLNAREGDS